MKNEMQVVSIMRKVNPVVKDFLKAFRQATGMNESQVIENIILDFSARIAACNEVAGQVREIYLPFLTNSVTGESIAGDALYFTLKERWIREFTVNGHEYNMQVADVAEKYGNPKSKDGNGRKQ